MWTCHVPADLGTVILPQLLCMTGKEPSIYDVRTDGEGEFSQKWTHLDSGQGGGSQSHYDVCSKNIFSGTIAFYKVVDWQIWW